MKQLFRKAAKAAFNERSGIAFLQNESELAFSVFCKYQEDYMQTLLWRHDGFYGAFDFLFLLLSESVDDMDINDFK